MPRWWPDKITCWRTSDGSEFQNLDEAQNHEAVLTLDVAIAPVQIDSGLEFIHWLGSSVELRQAVRIVLRKWEDDDGA